MKYHATEMNKCMQFSFFECSDYGQFKIHFHILPKNKKPSVNLRYRGFKVPRTGLEPVHPYGHRILSPACLPIPPPRQSGERKTGFEPATPTLARSCSTS